MSQGPEIRTGFLEKPDEPLKFQTGDEVTITTDYEFKGNKEMIAMRRARLRYGGAGRRALCVFGTLPLHWLAAMQPLQHICWPKKGAAELRLRDTAFDACRPMCLCDRAPLQHAVTTAPRTAPLSYRANLASAES